MRPSMPVRTGAVDVFGLRSQMPRLGARRLLTFEIGEGDIDVAHGHTWIDVASSSSGRGKADPGAKHLGGVGMPELVSPSQRYSHRPHRRP